MRITKALLIILLAVFPFGQLMKLPIGSEEINIFLQDLLVATLVAIWLILHLVKKISFARPYLTKPILFFIVTAIISLLVNSFRLNQKELLVSGFYLARWVVYAGVYFVVYDISIYHIQWRLRLRQGMILAGVATAILSLVQYFLYPDLRNLSYLGWDPHKFRTFGTFLDSNFLGIILVLTIILILEKLKKIKIITFINFIIVYLTLALTYSRASYLAYFVGVGLISFFRKKPRFLLIALMIGLATIPLLPKIEGEGGKLERRYTINSRILNWQQSLNIIKDHPLFGVGFNSYRYAQRDYGFLKETESHAGAGADASLLFVLATTGIVGTIAYLYLIYDILIYHIRKRDYIVIVSLLAILVHSFFNNTLFYSPVMLWMWMIIGLADKDPETSSG